jgi:hypothetical protein
MDEQAIEYHDIGGHLRQLVAPGIVGALCCSDQQAQEKRAHCCNECDGQLYDILCICARMVLGQRRPQKHSEQRTSEQADEDNAAYRNGAHD